MIENRYNSNYEISYRIGEEAGCTRISTWVFECHPHTIDNVFNSRSCCDIDPMKQLRNY